MSAFLDLAERLDIQAGDEFGTARLAQQLELEYALVDGLLQGTTSESQLSDDVLLRFAVLVAEYEKNKARYKIFKKNYVKPTSRVKGKC